METFYAKDDDDEQTDTVMEDKSMENATIQCPLMNGEIQIGLCEDIFEVACRCLVIEAVPEILGIPRDRIENVCLHQCPYSEP